MRIYTQLTQEQRYKGNVCECGPDYAISPLVCTVATKLSAGRNVMTSKRLTHTVLSAVGPNLWQIVDKPRKDTGYPVNKIA